VETQTAPTQNNQQQPIKSDDGFKSVILFGLGLALGLAIVTVVTHSKSEW